MPYPQPLTGGRGRLNARIIKGEHHKGDFIDTERRVACRADSLCPRMFATISKTASFATVGGNSCGVWCWRSTAEHGSRGARGRQARPRPRPSPRHRLVLVYAFQEQGSHVTLKRALTEHWGGVLPALSSAPNFPIQCRKQKKRTLRGIHRAREERIVYLKTKKIPKWDCMRAYQGDFDIPAIKL